MGQYWSYRFRMVEPIVAHLLAVVKVPLAKDK
jgi:hypothetical protein